MHEKESWSQVELLTKKWRTTEQVRKWRWHSFEPVISLVAPQSNPVLKTHSTFHLGQNVVHLWPWQWVRMREIVLVVDTDQQVVGSHSVVLAFQRQQ